MDAASVLPECIKRSLFFGILVCIVPQAYAAVTGVVSPGDMAKVHAKLETDCKTATSRSTMPELP
jgi:hypothetical protein